MTLALVLRYVVVCTCSTDWECLNVSLQDCYIMEWDKCDEMGVSIIMHRPEKVVAEVGRCHVNTVTSGEKGM